MAGNDDPPEIDAVLASSSRLEDVGGRVVEIAPGVHLASIGESTPTPWHTPRELPDEDLGHRVALTVDALPPGGLAIWNLHMPPHATGIDGAPELDADLRVQYDSDRSGGSSRIDNRRSRSTGTSTRVEVATNSAGPSGSIPAASTRMVC
jgi:Icc-related predicted phosphoesterase